MGEQSEEKKERNEALYNDFQRYVDGEMKMAEIMLKYDLSQSRIYELVNNYEKKYK